MDILIRFIRPADLPLPPPAQEDVRLREFAQADLPALLSISQSAFEKTRYFADEALRPRAPLAYAEWVKNNCQGRAQKVFVAELEGRLVGFICCLIAESDESGIIDLIAVAPGMQGLGLGSQLIGESLRWFRERVRSVVVGTQAHNAPAVQTYQKLGFRFHHCEATLHRLLCP
jgi:ribosomal protein S18 acetylase RimI-like enzyme